jgi:hypothetical protein
LNTDPYHTVDLDKIREKLDDRKNQDSNHPNLNG